MTRFVFGFVVLVCLGCQGPTGVGLAQLHVEATKSDGSNVVGFDGDNCTVLPILLGSRIETRVPIEPPFEAVVDATRDQAEVSFRGANGAPTVVLGEAALRSGHSEEVTVDAASGAEFRVTLTSSCPVTGTP